MRIGDPFPRVPLQTSDGPLDLATLWTDEPLVVAFHRLWCPFCHQAAAEMADRRDELGRVVLVYPQPVDEVARTCTDRALPFTCASDPGRTLEHAVGVPQLRPTRYLRTFTPRRVGAALRSGARPGLPNSNVFQGRGTFVLEPGGRVAYVHFARSVADLAPLDDVLAATVGRLRGVRA